jgi:hypothetical protein
MLARDGSNAAVWVYVQQLRRLGGCAVFGLTQVAMAQAPAAVPRQASPALPESKVSTLADVLSGQAKQEYEAGRLLYLDGDAASALVKFQSAYDLSHEPRLLWNLAACHKQLRHYAELERLLKRYLAEGNSVITNEDRVEANTLLQTIAPLLADATIQINEPGASIYVDRTLIGQSPLPEKVRLDLGTRKLRVDKPGFTTYEESIVVSGGAPLALNVTLTKEVHQGRLRIVADGGAEIQIDGQNRGFGVWVGTLPSGPHRVDVMAAGKLPYHSEVAISDNQTNTLRAMLEDRPAQSTGFDTTWFWVAGSALLATGLGVVGYYEFRPGHQTPSPPLGTLPPGSVSASFGRF